MAFEHFATKVNFDSVDIDGGFWQKKQNMNKATTLCAVQKSYINIKRFEAAKCKYKWYNALWYPKPHLFGDSDMGKWMEAAAYHLAKEKNAELESFIDGIVDDIEKSQLRDGYYNSHFICVRKNQKFKVRSDHELYNAGHLVEAAVAYFKATGKKKFLDVLCRYVDLIIEKCMVKQTAAFTTCGHPEMELAAIKLSEATGNKKYLDFAKFLVDVRGTDLGRKGLVLYGKPGKPFSETTYAQDHLPVREQITAEGHSVRAVYLYTAMAELARLYKDERLYEACTLLFDDIIERKMCITGGIGAKAEIEGFGAPYELPNDIAYNETCAGIGLMLFAQRMAEIEAVSKYHDTVERLLYNGFLSGISLDGERFFYENPLEIDIKNRKLGVRYPVSRRQKDFGCSCCPPNITRIVASLGDFIYTENKDTLLIHQYISNTVRISAKKGNGEIKLVSGFPGNGIVSVFVEDYFGMLAFRIPGWCEKYTSSQKGEVINGYLYIPCSGNSEITLDFSMSLKANYSDPRVKSNLGQFALSYGPIVYCAETVDNEKLTSYRLNPKAFKEQATTAYNEEYGANTVTLNYTEDGRLRSLHLIPYYAFANRGESDMRVYFYEMQL